MIAIAQRMNKTKWFREKSAFLPSIVPWRKKNGEMERLIGQCSGSIIFCYGSNTFRSLHWVIQFEEDDNIFPSPLPSAPSLTAISTGCTTSWTFMRLSYITANWTPRLTFAIRNLTTLSQDQSQSCVFFFSITPKYNIVVVMFPLSVCLCVFLRLAALVWMGWA